MSTGPDDHRCEGCGWSSLATHLLDFRDGGRTFLVCEPCALEGVEHGGWAALWIGLDEMERS